MGDLVLKVEVIGARYTAIWSVFLALKRAGSAQVTATCRRRRSAGQRSADLL